MNVLEAIRKRRSCRQFSNAPIPYHEAETLFAAALLAPSAGRLRTLTILPSLNAAAFAEAASQPWIASAPSVFVILADLPKIERKYHSRGRQYALLEAGHAAQNICLTATELGLGSCCVGAFRESKVLKALGLDRNCGLTPVYLVVVGRKK